MSEILTFVGVSVTFNFSKWEEMHKIVHSYGVSQVQGHISGGVWREMEAEIWRTFDMVFLYQIV